MSRSRTLSSQTIRFLVERLSIRSWHCVRDLSMTSLFETGGSSNLPRVSLLWRSFGVEFWVQVGRINVCKIFMSKVT